jgi:transcriptional regulator GlxA family with amidase domain
MLHLIESNMGDAVMTEVACWFQHPLVRASGVQQRIPAFHADNTSDSLPAAVTKAIDIFSASLEEPVSMHNVAARVGLSPRQLERSFKSATGQSPSQYYRTLRMKAARQLVIYSRNSITSIANAVGYGTSATFSQYYRESFGLTPQEERRKTNMFRVRDNRPLPSV